MKVIHGDARSIALPQAPDGVITSPPYPGLIDYHEQHRYAYELLGLDDRRELEIGAAAGGRTRGALAKYVESMADALSCARSLLAAGAPVVIVVNDSRRLYPQILDARGPVARASSLTRHVNRRTGLRGSEFFESVLVCRA